MIISPCVGCVAAKIARSHNFPVFCPMLQKVQGSELPCLALAPEYINGLIERSQTGITESDATDIFQGIPCGSEKVSTEFIQKMLDTEKDLATKGIITEYKESNEI